MKLRPQPIVGVTFVVFILVQLVIYVAIVLARINVPSLGNEVVALRLSNSQPFISRLLSIYANNLKLASLSLIPALGLLFYFIFTFDTAIAASSYFIEAHLTPFALLLLFLKPDTIIELSAYSIGMVANLYIISRVIIPAQRSFRNVRNFFYLYGFMALILFVAAFFETADIKHPLAWGKYFDLYWIPAIPVIIGLFFIYWKLIRPKLAEPEDDEDLLM